jgi:hypothetical protein
MSRRIRFALLVAAVVAAACSGPVTPFGSSPSRADSTPAATAAPATPTPTPTPSLAALTPAPDAPATVWLCRPGLANNPCTGSLVTTVINPSGRRTVSTPVPAVHPPIDCFYVYPTVSRQKGMNATLSVDPEEKAVAQAQAALFSQVCDVYAPIYPQLTLRALDSGKTTFAEIDEAYVGLVSAFDDYLAHDNHGRGIVFIGHSQGALLLRALLRLNFDSSPDLRKLLVSALLMGGNVSVEKGKTTGGDFAHIPACTFNAETGCVVAYSTYDKTPPANSVFGRTTGPLQMFDLGGHGGQQEILCVNPAAIGGSGVLDPYFATSYLKAMPGAPRPLPRTPFISYPNAVSAQCMSKDGASWLQVSRLPTGRSLTLTASRGPAWGLHEADVSLALGDLVDLVRTESAAFEP